MSFWCLFMVRGCGIILPQSKASLLHNFLVWIAFNLSLIFLKVLECVFIASKYGLRCYTLAFFQVLSGPSFSPGTLHFAAKLVAPCSFISSKSLCLMLHRLVLQQFLFWRCLWLGIAVFCSLLLYFLKCIVIILVLDILDCIAILWPCSIRRWYVFVAMYFSSPAYIFLHGSVTHLLSQCLYIRFLFMMVSRFLGPCSRFIFGFPSGRRNRLLPPKV